jgi:hypothetical protein
LSVASPGGRRRRRRRRWDDPAGPGIWLHAYARRCSVSLVPGSERLRGVADGRQLCCAAGGHDGTARLLVACMQMPACKCIWPPLFVPSSAC